MNWRILTSSQVTYRPYQAHHASLQAEHYARQRVASKVEQASTSLFGFSCQWIQMASKLTGNYSVN